MIFDCDDFATERILRKSIRDRNVASFSINIRDGLHCFKELEAADRFIQQTIFIKTSNRGSSESLLSLSVLTQECAKFRNLLFQLKRVEFNVINLRLAMPR